MGIKEWRDYCKDIERYPDVARLLQILAKDPKVLLKAIRLPTGEYTTSEEECLKLFLQANLPGFRLSHNMKDESSGRNKQQRAAKVVTPEKVKSAIRNFQPFKAPSIDGIYPAFLQEGLEELVGPLVKLFRASVALAHVPEIWKTARVVFILKTGMTSQTTVKDYRPISLNSFVFKTLDRAGFSTETELHSAVWRIEEQLKMGKIMVGVFLDIEGAFNCISIEAVVKEAGLYGMPGPLIKWLKGMLTHRTVISSLGTVTVSGKVRSEIGAAMDAMQLALRKVERWCCLTGLSVNLDKVEMVIFSRKYKLNAYRAPKLSGVALQAKDSAKYLGIVLDKKLTWVKHLTAQAVLVPRLAYAALVWWPWAVLVGARAALEKLRGLRGAAWAYRTTPTKALGILVKVEPLHLGMAAKVAHRLNVYGQWTQGTRHTRLSGGVGFLPEFSIKTDIMIPRFFFGRRYGVVIPTREEWKARRDSLPGTGDVWYTDGSRAETGSRYYCRRDERGTFFSLRRYAMVLQTKIYAILTCAQRNIELGARDKIITICSDSQAALMAHRTTYRLGAKQSLIGPEPYTVAARCLLAGEIRDWVEREHTKAWQGTQGCRQARLVNGQDTNVGLTKCIAGGSRNNSRLLIQIVTRQIPLRYHSLKMGKEATGVCRWCEGAEETPTHVLTVCPKFVQLRHQCLKELFPTCKEIRALDVGAILTFSRRTGSPA
ncbi:uncharacterized protein LOC103317660 [Nasonia vitripennis]|uniref:Reverse transcriptase domain-containing protein n=1 Tax=Nasonia vitripennis TaxID=7425 RepID=A0A7M7HAF5_NASVI|nr:uncharacterized protein LOC103317660 [Nasonia vitripennis]